MEYSSLVLRSLILIECTHFVCLNIKVHFGRKKTNILNRHQIYNSNTILIEIFWIPVAKSNIKILYGYDYIQLKYNFVIVIVYL